MLKTKLRHFIYQDLRIKLSFIIQTTEIEIKLALNAKTEFYAAE